MGRGSLIQDMDFLTMYSGGRDNGVKEGVGGKIVPVVGAGVRFVRD